MSNEILKRKGKDASTRRREMVQTKRYTREKNDLSVAALTNKNPCFVQRHKDRPKKKEAACLTWPATGGTSTVERYCSSAARTRSYSKWSELSNRTKPVLPLSHSAPSFFSSSIMMILFLCPFLWLIRSCSHFL